MTGYTSALGAQILTQLEDEKDAAILEIQTEGAAQVALAGDQVAAAVAASLTGRFQIDNKATYVAVTPGSAWNGTVGTGFSGSPPVDPTRTTAKPSIRPLMPPMLWFTDYQIVGVAAGANNLGDLSNMGLEKVIVHYEGRQVEILQPSFYSYQDVNGKTRSAFGWWAVLVNTASYGHAQVYFEAVPKDATMQRRVIGPYQYSPQAAKHDITLTIAPSLSEVVGSRYQNFKNAATYLRAQGKLNPLLVYSEAGSQIMEGPASAYNPANGRVTIQATAAVSLVKAVSATTLRLVTPLHIRGSNITLDFAGANEFYCEDAQTQQHVLEGCNITDSAPFPSLIGREIRTSSALFRAMGTAPNLNGPWVIDCNVSNLGNALCRVNLARGNTITNCYGDLFTGAQADGENVTVALDGTQWIVGLAAITINAYTGAASTATVSMSGSGTGRTFTFKENGASIGSWVANGTSASTTNYQNQHLVDYINALGAGWSATLVDNQFFARQLSRQTGTPGAAFTDVSVKSAPLPLWSRVDMHGDWRQGIATNVVMWNETAYNLRGQNLFIDGAWTDVVMVNCAFHNNETPVGDYVITSSLSQIGNTHSHSVIVHNTWATQRVTISGARDAYCNMSSNTMPRLSWTDAGDADMLLADNHLQDAATAPTYATGTVISGTNANLFTNSAAGDFASRGALVTNMKPPRVKHDFIGARRGSASAVGASI